MFLRQTYRAAAAPSSGAALLRLSTAAVTTMGQTRTTTRSGVTTPQIRPQARHLHVSPRMQAVKSVLFTDIGEGIVECEVIQWFVQPGARVEEFAPLCEVQSDKATVEVTSRYAGVVKKLYHEAGEMVRVGKPFIDIDVPEGVAGVAQESAAPEPAAPTPASEPSSEPSTTTPTSPPKKFSGSALATPAVRHLSKELDVDITQVDGTGKDGRVLKEDVHRYAAERKRAAAGPAPGSSSSTTTTTTTYIDTPQTETTVPLAGTQLQMFKSMTRSLAIPHFLYADEVDFTQLHELRQWLNNALASGKLLSTEDSGVAKLSYLPFVIKAVSQALHQYPILNARVDTASSDKPQLVFRAQHNIGVAMDTPAGLIVPVVRNVQARSVLAIAAELARLQALAQANRLAPADLQGGTITVSNIGNIGGSYLSPVVVDREVAILAMGRMRTVPAFGEGGETVVKKHVCHFSFSADHRVVDGATLARAAEVVRQMVEQPAMMAVQLR